MKLDLTEVIRNPRFHFLLGAVLASITIYFALHITPNFDQRTIGITVLHGQDVAARNAIYVFSVLSGTCFLLALFLKLPFTVSSSSLLKEPPNHGVILGVVLLSNLLLYFLYSKPVFLNAFYALSYLALLGVVINSREKDIHLRDFRWIIVALSYHALIVGYCIAGEHPEFGIGFFSIFSLILFFAHLVYEKVSVKRGDYASLVPISTAFWPLMLLPMMIIIANEAQYTLQSRYSVHFQGLSIWLTCTLFLAILGFSIYHRIRGKMNGYTGPASAGILIGKLLNERYLPLIIVTTVAFTEYSEVIDFFRVRDFFHGGEALVPIQQLLQFGSIPFIDFYPPHGLFDMLPQLLYQIVNQTSVPESVLWGEGYFLGWLPRMLAAMLVYWFLGRFLSYKTSFLVMFALPTYHLLHPYYALFILPAMALAKTSKTFPQWLGFWSLVFGLVLWRIDFGLAVLAATTFVIAADFLSERTPSNLTHSIAAFLLVFVASTLIFLVLSWQQQLSPQHIARQIANYAQIQTATAGLEKIVRQLDFAAALQYLILPLVGVLYLAYFSALAIRGDSLNGLHRVLAFLAVSSLVISVRSLNRHSHYEGVFNPYFFILVVSLTPVLLSNFSRTFRIALFLAICVGSYTLLPDSKSYFQLAYYQMGVEKEYAAPASYRTPILLSEAPQNATRLVSDNSGAENIEYFLSRFLQSNSTFYDFTNSPILYALTEKRLPSFISETLFHTSESIQRALISDLEGLYKKDELPVVLFRQNNRWDKIDGVDTAVRSYRVAEYIYKNFAPCVSIDNYEVWLSKKILRGQNCAEHLRYHLAQNNALSPPLQKAMRAATSGKQVFDLHKLPYVWANFDDFDPIGSSSSSQELRIVPVDTLEQKEYQLQLPEDINSDNGNYIYFRILSAHEGRVQLTYADGNSVSFDVISDPEAQDYLIRISTQYAWYQGDFDRMQLLSSIPISLLHAAILPGD